MRRLLVLGTRLSRPRRPWCRGSGYGEALPFERGRSTKTCAGGAFAWLAASQPARQRIHARGPFLWRCRMRILRLLSDRLLPCGCRLGIYETYVGPLVQIVDARAAN